MLIPGKMYNFCHLPPDGSIWDLYSPEQGLVRIISHPIMFIKQNIEEAYNIEAFNQGYMQTITYWFLDGKHTLRRPVHIKEKEYFFLCFTMVEQ